MKVGFTGTQRGMNQFQKDAVREILHELRATEFHYGDCVGADVESFRIAKSLGIKTHSHPPINGSKRAWTKADVEYEPKEYLVRDDDIVDMTEILIATPKSEIEERRSGTWYTVRRARKLLRKRYMVYPTRVTVHTLKFDEPSSR